jgi:hypothetical protein
MDAFVHGPEARAASSASPLTGRKARLPGIAPVPLKTR